MQKALVVVNPISGGKNKQPIIDLIERNLSKEISHEFIYWERPEQKTDIVERLKEDTFDIAIAVGGDGTINQVGSALVGSSKKLGIIPVGSGNGLARHLNIPLDPRKAIDIINRRMTVPMDACTVNDTFFFCASGIGFDAHIVKLFADSKKRGFFTYLRLSLSEFIGYKARRYTLKTDGVEVNERAFLVTIANASQYGNNAYIAPQASVSDGIMDICVMRPFNIFQGISMCFKLFNKTLNPSSSMLTYRTNEVVIEREEDGPIHCDGEPLMAGKILIYKIFPKALNVIVP